VHAVVQTPSFLKGAERAGLTDVVVDRIVDAVAAAPHGDETLFAIEGLCRRLLRHTETGAEEDLEVLHYFAGDDIPVFLLEISFAGEALQVTKRQRVELSETLSEIATHYRASARAKVIEFKSARSDQDGSA
jgi:hypothetical protein